MSAKDRFAFSCSNAMIMRSTASRGRLSCTKRPLECVSVAPTVPPCDIQHVSLAAVSDGRVHRTLLELDGASLTIGDALDVARQEREVRLAEHAARAVQECRELKRSLIA